MNSQKITDTKSKKLKKERSVDKAKTEIINAIIEQLKDILEDSIENKDSTDGIIDIITEIFQPLLDEFKDLIEENEDKKSFIGGLIKIFTILLSSKTTSLTKIKNVIRISTNHFYVIFAFLRHFLTLLFKAMAYVISECESRLKQ